MCYVHNQWYDISWATLYIFPSSIFASDFPNLEILCLGLQARKESENVAKLTTHIVKLCRALSEDLCRKFVTNARVRLQEAVRQNGGHIEHVLY